MKRILFALVLSIFLVGLYGGCQPMVPKDNPKYPKELNDQINSSRTGDGSDSTATETTEEPTEQPEETPSEEGTE